MFTGLIEEIGTVTALARTEITLKCRKILDGVKIGDSISVNGCCLSVTKKSPDKLSFHVSPMTAKTTRLRPGSVRIGEKLNMERAMQMGQRLDGHIVTGHIDCTSKIVSITPQGEDWLIEVMVPKDIAGLIARKGSVAIDGVSLTVAERKSSSFTVQLVPITLEKTNLKQKRAGDLVHLEADIIARYAQNYFKYSSISH